MGNRQCMCSIMQPAGRLQMLRLLQARHDSPDCYCIYTFEYCINK